MQKVSLHVLKICAYSVSFGTCANRELVYCQNWYLTLWLLSAPSSLHGPSFAIRTVSHNTKDTNRRKHCFVQPIGITKLQISDDE